MTSTRNGRQIGSWVLRGLLTVFFLIAAGMKFAAVEFEVSGFARFGYPLWFMYAVGIAQLVGAILLLSRRHVAHGALLLAAIMVGAVASHLRAGDPALMPVPAFVLLIVLSGLAYARRSELPGAAPSAAALRA
ncbi:DoxX family protein [Methylobacterium sp. A54F]